MNRTIVITGGTGGIGRQTAIALARQGHRVVVTGRDPKRGEEGIAAIERASGSEDVHLALGDLSVRSSVDALARELVERFSGIDVLINNAGLLTTERATTPDGVESDFAVNVVAPYALTHAVLPALPRGARVINVTGGLPLGPLDTGNLFAERSFEGLRTYSHAKRAMEAMSLELARELSPRGVAVVVVYPGSASTAMSAGITPGSLPWWMFPLWPVFRLVMQRDDGGKSAARASRSSVWAATSPDVEGGRAFDAGCKPMKLHASVIDAANRAAVLGAVRRAAGISTSV